jgi:hypothetical protein
LERHNVGRRGATIRYSARGLEAFFECDVSHYPRFLADNGKETKVDENEIVTRIAAELNKLTESKSNPLGDNLTRARESPMRSKHSPNMRIRRPHAKEL